MAGGTWPSISSALDETNAALDRLLQPGRDRRDHHRRSLESIVARLEVVGPPDELEPGMAPRRDERSVGSGRGPAQDPAPFVALPQRTTHGGDYGPQVRAKLVNEALSRRGWS